MLPTITSQVTVPTCHPSPPAAESCYWAEAHNGDGVGGRKTHPADPTALITWPRRSALRLGHAEKAPPPRWDSDNAPDSPARDTHRCLLLLASGPVSPQAALFAGRVAVCALSHGGGSLGLRLGPAGGQAAHLLPTPSCHSASLPQRPGCARAVPGVAGGTCLRPHTHPVKTLLHTRESKAGGRLSR